MHDLLADGFGPVALAFDHGLRLYGEGGPMDVPMPAAVGGLHRASDGGVLVAYAGSPWLDHIGMHGELVNRWPLPCTDPARAAGPNDGGQPWVDCFGTVRADVGNLVSPDGRFVVKTRFHRGPAGPVLRIRDRSKGVEVARLLAHFVWEPAWDPTGRFLAGVVRERPLDHPEVSDSGQGIVTDSGIHERGPSATFRLVIIDLLEGEVRRMRARRIRALGFSEDGSARHIMRDVPVRVPLWRPGWQALTERLENKRELLDRRDGLALLAVDDSTVVVLREGGGTREVLPLAPPLPSPRVAWPAYR